MIYYGLKFQSYLEWKASKTYDPKPLIIYSSIFPILLGMVLSIPNYISKREINGVWQFDWIKCVVVGTPTLLIAVIPIFTHTSVSNHWLFFEFLGPEHQLIAGLIFGYVILGSFDKRMPSR